MGAVSRWGVRLRRAPGRLTQALWPNQRLRWTREGPYYLLAWCGLLVLGLYHQNNMVLLTAGLAAGPLVSSVLAGAAMLRKLSAERRAPRYVFAGQTLSIEYVLRNKKRWLAALAMTIEDDFQPRDRTLPGAARGAPRAFLERVPAGRMGRTRWMATAPGRGRYAFRTLELMTAFPFGLLERRVTFPNAGEFVVYPEVGRLTRSWRRAQHDASETSRGRRQERSIHQQEYHGLREYRSGDSTRDIHWRTTARLGSPMVKEFEVQHDQDLALLIDPWAPRNGATAEQREAVEEAVRFAATVCLETCRRRGRRLLVGWTGATPGHRQGQASARLLHEVLEQLATLRSTSEEKLSELLDQIPAATTREAFLVIVSTRPVNPADLARDSKRLGGGQGRGLGVRTLILDASKGDTGRYYERFGTNAGAGAAPAKAAEAAPGTTGTNGAASVSSAAPGANGRAAGVVVGGEREG